MYVLRADSDSTENADYVVLLLEAKLRIVEIEIKYWLTTTESTIHTPALLTQTSLLHNCIYFIVSKTFNYFQFSILGRLIVIHNIKLP